MNVRVLTGVLVFIMIVNIAAVDAYVYYHMMGASAEPPQDVLPGPRSLGREQGGDPLAGLDEQQRNRLREIMEEFRKSTGELNGRIRTLDDEIFKLIQTDSIQSERIARNLEDISTARLEINRIAIDKILKTKSFLSREQQTRLFNAIFRMKPGGPPPQGSVEAPQDAAPDGGSDSTAGRLNIPPPHK
jgi:Spy/CpxP family protein refolding chaperone